MPTSTSVALQFYFLFIVSKGIKSIELSLENLMQLIPLMRS